jgi:hypothetical protein
MTTFLWRSTFYRRSGSTVEITAEKAEHNLALARELIRRLDEALEGDH